MRRSWVVPVAWAAGAVLYVVLVGWLMLHGHLDLAVLLVGLAVVGLLGLAGWRWRAGHRRWAAAARGRRRCRSWRSPGGTATASTRRSRPSPASTSPRSPTRTSGRPPKAPNKAVNILLMGADNPHRLVKKPTVAELLEDGEVGPRRLPQRHDDAGPHPGRPEDGVPGVDPARLLRPDLRRRGQAARPNKINEAFAAYGPLGTWRTVEKLSDVRIDHMAVIDYAGFNELTEAIGGVDVYIPETVTDTQQHVTWEQGLDPPRGRAGAPVRADAPRAAGGRLRPDRPAAELPARGAPQDPGRRHHRQPVQADSKVLSAISAHLAVDGDWSTKDIRGLALSLRGIDARRSGS